MRRFCSVCGRVTDELIENMCGRCYVDERRPMKITPRIEARACKDCLRYFRRGRWTNAKEEKGMLEEAALAAAEDSIRVEMPKPKVELFVGTPKKTSASVYLIPFTATAKGRIEGLEIEAEESAEVRLSLGICEDCSRQRGGYYEAILQLRGDALSDENKRREVRRFVLERAAKGEERRAFVARIEEPKEGLDFYLGSAKVARKLARALQQKFGGTTTESAKLFGKREGKEIYRVTIAVRLPKTEKF